MQRRKSWNNKPVIQISGDSDSREAGNKFSKLVLQKNSLKKTIHKPFISQDSFKLKEETKLVFQNYHPIDPRKKFEVPKTGLPEGVEYPEGIQYLAFSLPNVTRPKIHIQLSENYSPEQHTNVILESPLTKAKENINLKDFLEKAQPDTPYSYTGGGLNETIKKIIIQYLSPAV